MDPVSVTKAMPDHDAALCSIGAGRSGKIRSQGTKNIIDAMQSINIVIPKPTFLFIGKAQPELSL